uniref:Histone methylation DOT1 family protein n=1 Tax=Cyanothece sp. (strain PCC 7425 / ATCC 29141) TaxID=395961 RepID=B8HLY7_CYAP4
MLSLPIQFIPLLLGIGLASSGLNDTSSLFHEPGVAVWGTKAIAQVPAPAQPHSPYVPSTLSVVEEMLRVAQVTNNDLVYDLGSGDGRVVIIAAQKYGARGVGVDIDPQRIQEAKVNAQRAGVSDRVRFIQQDLFQTDISAATVVTLYLLPEANLQLRPKLLRELKPGTRIVSNTFRMGNWKPEQAVYVNGRGVYLWVVPTSVPEALR